jgi:hypothetical protein
MKLLIMQFLQPPVTPSLLGPNILLSNLFSNTLSLCHSLNARDQVSHPYRRTGKITLQVYYIAFLGSKVSQNDCTMWNMPYKYKNVYYMSEVFTQENTVVTHEAIQKYIQINIQ